MRTFAQIFAYFLLAVSALVGVSAFFGAFIAFGLGLGMLMAFVAPMGMASFAFLLLLLCSIDERLEAANRRRDVQSRLA